MKGRPLISMRQALADPLFFGDIMSGTSWYAWRTILIATFDMSASLTRKELATFTKLIGRTRQPKKPPTPGVPGRSSPNTFVRTCIPGSRTPLPAPCRCMSFPRSPSASACP
jgi:hypothetical protein